MEWSILGGFDKKLTLSIFYVISPLVDEFVCRELDQSRELGSKITGAQANIFWKKWVLLEHQSCCKRVCSSETECLPASYHGAASCVLSTDFYSNFISPTHFRFEVTFRVLHGRFVFSSE